MFHADHLNTPRLIADAAGTTVWRHDQAEPFANNPPDENPSALGVFEFPLRDEGTYFDKETGLLYNINRYRDTGIGRFPQADPQGLDGGDLSLYVLRKNNPLSFTDPKGLRVTPGLGSLIRPVQTFDMMPVEPMLPMTPIPTEAFDPVTSPIPGPTAVPTDRPANDPTNPDCPPELQDYCTQWRDNLIYQRFLILYQEQAGLNVALNKRNFNKNRNQFCRACPSMCKDVRRFD